MDSDIPTPLKTHFFTTNREFGLTYLYVLDAAKTLKVQDDHERTKNTSKTAYWELDPIKLKNYSRYIYYPTKFETLSRKEIDSFRKNLNYRFYKHYYLNSKEISDIDRKYLSNKSTSLAWSMFLSAGMVLFTNNMLQKIEIPFNQLNVFEKFATKGTRRVTMGLLAGYLFYNNYSSFLEDNYMYDMSLVYKNQFCGEKELVSPNCEHEIPGRVSGGAGNSGET
jgi:hypothetical protein